MTIKKEDINITVEPDRIEKDLVRSYTVEGSLLLSVFQYRNSEVINEKDIEHLSDMVKDKIMYHIYRDIYWKAFDMFKLVAYSGKPEIQERAAELMDEIDAIYKGE